MDQPQEKKPCYLCRLLKNIVIFSLGTTLGIVIGFLFARG